MTRAVNTALAGAGGVLQVVSVNKSDAFSLAADGWTDVPGLSLSILPGNTTNKIVILCVLSLGYQYNVTKIGYRLLRNGNPIALGDPQSARTQASGSVYIPVTQYATSSAVINFCDSPSTSSAVTYKVQVIRLDNSGTIHVNRPDYWGDAFNFNTAVSSITATEIAG